MDHGPFGRTILKPELCWVIKVPPLQSAVLNWGNKFKGSSSVSCRGQAVPLKTTREN